MIILTTTLFLHVLAKHGILWEGAGAAWLLAAICDTGIYLFIAYCIWKPH